MTVVGPVKVLAAVNVRVPVPSLVKPPSRVAPRELSCCSDSRMLMALVTLSMIAPPDLTMIVPTYNERDRFAELTRALFEETAAAGIRLELVVVDDNSPDGTGAIADALAGTYRMKVIRRTSKLKVHDEQNSAGVGDRVLMMETRPLSATKRWRLVEILEKAK